MYTEHSITSKKFMLIIMYLGILMRFLALIS